MKKLLSTREAKSQARFPQREKNRDTYLNKLQLSTKERSDHEKYISNFYEVAASDSMDIYSNDDYIEHMPGSVIYKEKEIEELYTAIDQLTDKQQNIIIGYLAGMTHVEIAKELNINQSSVSLAIYGSRDYKTGHPERVYGGILKKLKKIIEENK